MSELIWSHEILTQTEIPFPAVTLQRMSELIWSHEILTQTETPFLAVTPQGKSKLMWSHEIGKHKQKDQLSPEEVWSDTNRDTLPCSYPPGEEWSHEIGKHKQKDQLPPEEVWSWDTDTNRDTLPWSFPPGESKLMWSTSSGGNCLCQYLMQRHPSLQLPSRGKLN